jgi:hypothetical protein
MVVTSKNYVRNAQHFTYGTCPLCARTGERLVTDYCHACGWIGDGAAQTGRCSADPGRMPPVSVAGAGRFDKARIAGSVREQAA